MRSNLFLSAFLALALLSAAFMAGCGTPAYEKHPDMLAAKARLEAARKAHEAAQAELDALRAKKKAEVKLKEARASQAAADEAEVHDKK